MTRAIGLFIRICTVILRHIPWQAILTVCLAVFGWWYVGDRNSKRDFAAKQREVRIQYLIGAYRRMERGASRTLHDDKDLRDYGHSVEDAIGDIQLFGSEEQVKLARDVVTYMRGPGASADLKPLLKALRRDLRQELQLPALQGDPVQLRFVPKNGSMPAKRQQR